MESKSLCMSNDTPSHGWLEHRAVNYLPTVLPIGKFLWTMSIHAFLTGDEWFVWLVKGQQERRMSIKLSGWWTPGSRLLLSLPSSLSFLFHVIVHKRAATASNASLKLKRVKRMICECWLASLLDYTWTATTAFCLLWFAVVVNHGSSIWHRSSSSNTTCFQHHESNGCYQSEREEQFIFRIPNYSWYRFFFPVYRSVAYLTFWRLTIWLLHLFLFGTVGCLLTSRDAFTDKGWLAVGERQWLLTSFSLSLMTQRQPLK